MIIHPMLEAIFGDVDQASVRWCVLWGETRLADPTGDVIYSSLLLIDRAGPRRGALFEDP